MTSIEAIFASLDPVVAALAFAVLMAGVTCYVAVTAAGRESAARNRALVLSGALCALTVGFAVVIWLLQARAR